MQPRGLAEGSDECAASCLPVITTLGTHEMTMRQCMHACILPDQSCKIDHMCAVSTSPWVWQCHVSWPEAATDLMYSLELTCARAGLQLQGRLMCTLEPEQAPAAHMSTRVPNHT